MRIAYFIQKISSWKSTFKHFLSSGEGLRNGSFLNQSGVGYTEELNKGERSQKLNFIQFPSKSAFHNVAYFVQSLL